MNTIKSKQVYTTKDVRRNLTKLRINILKGVKDKTISGETIFQKYREYIAG